MRSTNLLTYLLTNPTTKYRCEFVNLNCKITTCLSLDKIPSCMLVNSAYRFAFNAFVRYIFCGVWKATS